MAHGAMSQERSDYGGDGLRCSDGGLGKAPVGLVFLRIFSLYRRQSSGL